MGPTIDEFKSGTLHSGSKNGPIVKSHAQAVAIGLSEDKKAAGGKLSSALGKLAAKRKKPNDHDADD
jgi:hypothetical protein